MGKLQENTVDLLELSRKLVEINGVPVEDRGEYEIAYLDKLPEGMMIDFKPKNGAKPLLIVGTMTEEEQRKNRLAGNESAQEF